MSIVGHVAFVGLCIGVGALVALGVIFGCSFSGPRGVGGINCEGIALGYSFMVTTSLLGFGYGLRYIVSQYTGAADRSRGEEGAATGLEQEERKANQK
jgi:Na+-driven multidrug efflux pump